MTDDAVNGADLLPKALELLARAIVGTAIVAAVRRLGSDGPEAMAVARESGRRLGVPLLTYFDQQVRLTVDQIIAEQRSLG